MIQGYRPPVEAAPPEEEEGFFLVPMRAEEPEPAAASEEETAPRVVQGDSDTLSDILRGAAAYCRRLQEAVPRFICQEKVSERIEKIQSYRVEGRSEYDARTGVMLQGLRDRGGGRRYVRRLYSHTETYDYQILRSGSGLSETRVPLKRKSSKRFSQSLKERLRTFFSVLVVLSPVNILGPEARRTLDYRRVHYEDEPGGRVAVIDVSPRDSGDTASITGRVWIDTRDFSIRRIRIDPRSVTGYYRLQNIAEQIGAQLILSCEIDFDLIHRGIRYPTRVRISERYRGGPLVRLIGKKIWERGRVEFQYRDHRFFEVSTEETVR